MKKISTRARQKAEPYGSPDVTLGHLSKRCFPNLLGGQCIPKYFLPHPKLRKIQAILTEAHMENTQKNRSEADAKQPLSGALK